jgi:undecaprenyl pyrophosphate phosphatase UppP
VKWLLGYIAACFTAFAVYRIILGAALLVHAQCLTARDRE